LYQSQTIYTCVIHSST